MNKTKELFEHDLKIGQYGQFVIAGCDEAGRGPLAGPVVCACCVMPLDEDKFIDKINDSKKLSEKLREELYEKIVSSALAYSIVVIDNDVIDQINILQATIKGATQSIEEVKSKCKDAVFLVDALKLDIADAIVFPIVKGDAKSYNIAAASILAKVIRDRILIFHDIEYPQYGFKQHKGYGTKQHIEAIKTYGITKIHRRSFLRNYEYKS
ncbi:MAG: ribonuclease HII [Firmicutes bacterium]|nr:ribonuclease HII [Bacillota bacterium]